MKTYKVFGRITGTKVEVLDCLTFFDSSEMLVCYEKADDGCSRDHCHFIAQKDYKNLKNLREAFSYKCKQILKETLRYSIKEYEEQKDCEAYICKGHKKDAAVRPDILINTYGIDVQECYERFHKTAQAYKEEKKTKNTWKAVAAFIEEVNPDLFKNPFTKGTPIRIASHLYDWYLMNDKMIQGKYVQQMIITTIIANKFNNKELKKLIVSTWCDDIAYWNGMEMTCYTEVEDAFNDL